MIVEFVASQWLRHGKRSHLEFHW